MEEHSSRASFTGNLSIPTFEAHRRLQRPVFKWQTHQELWPQAPLTFPAPNSCNIGK